jgi:nitrite reductase (NADH) small subunit
MAALVRIGVKDDFPEGEGRVVGAEGKKYAVFNSEGNIYAIDNTCPHEAGPLGEGMLSEGKVTCPHHGWVFDVRSGQCDFFDAVKVETFGVKVNEKGEVFLEIK